MVSGDSLGHVQFWDGRTGVLQQTVAKHTADVLCLAASRDEDRVFASGVDSKIICCERVSGDEKRRGRWVYTYSHRPHSHDVNALCVCGPEGSPELLCSGGIDTKLCTYRVRDFDQWRPRRLWPFPHQPLCSFAPRRRQLLVQHRRKLELWRLLGDPSSPQRDLRLRLKPHGGHGIASSALSPEADLVVCSDSLRLRVYHVGERSGVEKCKLPPSCAKPATRLAFASSGNRIVAAGFDGVLRVIEVRRAAAEEGPSFALAGEVPFGGEHAITHCVVSEDEEWAAVATWDRRAHVISLDKLSTHWTLPVFSSRITTMRFHPQLPYLVLATADNSVHVGDIEQRRFTTWSKDLQGQLPQQLRNRPECIVHIAFDPAVPSRFLLAAQGFLCFVDMDRPVPKNASISGEGDMASPTEEEEKTGTSKGNGAAAAKRRKRRRSQSGEGAADGDADEQDAQQSNFAISLKFRNVLGVDWPEPGELMVVETSWLHVINNLPDALFRARFGT